MITTKFWRAITDTVYAFTIVPYILNHKYRTKKYSEAVDEKFGDVENRISSRECLLIHAVSVGEVIAAESVIAEFTHTYPDWDIHISVSTATGREVAKKRYPHIPVSFFPLDLSIWVKRFLLRIRPTAILLMELEVWPNFLSLCKSNKIPVIVVNGRITEKSMNSYRKYKRFPVLKQMLEVPEYWLAQNSTYAKRFEEIGVEKDKILTIGSVKYDTIPTEPSNKLTEEYRKAIGASPNDKIIIAGSTHSPEEGIILKSYSELKYDHPNIKLVIVPRHPHRFDDVYIEATKYGKCIKYTELEKLGDDEANGFDIIIVDKMGILSSIYNAADIVFIGGSFIEHGGQNMLETCGIGKPTIIGPSYYNFSESVEILLEADGIKVVATAEGLTQQIKTFLSDYSQAMHIGAAGRAALLKHKGSSKKTIEILSNILTKGL